MDILQYKAPWRYGKENHDKLMDKLIAQSDAYNAEIKPPTEPKRLTYQIFIRNECREYEMKLLLPIGSIEWKDILYNKMIISYEELQNYDC